MKKLMSFTALLFAALVSYSQGSAEASQPASDYAVASIDNLVHDFGKIKQGVPVNHEFTFVNKGQVPMIITNAQPSCGCTVPAWSKDPIPPGGSGYVKATFNAAAGGVFDKSITVMANVEGGVIMLRIRGEVVMPTPNK